MAKKKIKKVQEKKNGKKRGRKASFKVTGETKMVVLKYPKKWLKIKEPSGKTWLEILAIGIGCLTNLPKVEIKTNIPAKKGKK